jgi:Ser/Thr protein kinase RdoA (MazF antagonist)
MATLSLPFDKQIVSLLGRPFRLSANDLHPISVSQNTVFETREREQNVILRVSHNRGRTQNEVAAELDWIDQLAGRGLPVCRGLPAADGHRVDVQNHDGIEYLTVCFERAPGRRILPEDLGSDLAFRLGCLTAQLHQAAQEPDAMTLSAQERRPLWTESRLLTSDLQTFLPPEDSLFRNTMRALIAELEPAVKQDQRLVHGDISYGNAFLDDDTVWIFDFDNCETGSILQDFSTILFDSFFSSLIRHVPKSEISATVQRQWNSFLTGYRTICPELFIDAALLRQFVILREGILYIHYHRMLQGKEIAPAFRAGMQQMHDNVVRRIPAFELPCWSAAGDRPLPA